MPIGGRVVIGVDVGVTLRDLVAEAADDRAMTMAHKLSIELRAAEDRISHLEAEIDRLEVRATRAEQWLKVIKKEIEDKLIAPMEANRPELPVIH
jgi:predicted  nucleic acid-binding Zn-ribbon protein